MNDINARLRVWVDEQWPNLTTNDFALKPEFHRPQDQAPQWQALSGDAGFRRYFRLASEPSLLAVYAPPETENTQAFVQVAQLLRKAGVLAPAIAAWDQDQGFLVIEDLGPQLMLDQLTPENAEFLYEEALACLLQIQLSPCDDGVLPVYTRERLRDELELFREWFVGALLGYELNIKEQKMLDELFTQLEDSALEQPSVLVHRDLHSRNLIYRAGGPPGVIDFQDAVIGPVTYDLVSLLRDCYVSWPQEQVRRWATAYARQAHAAGIMPVVEPAVFERWFDWMGLQRHIKVLGVFARLSLRDDKHGYLNDLPLVVDYVRSVAGLYDVHTDFSRWFEEQLMPKIVEQVWYRGSD